jgi:transcriptional/translational regulatory protein YebC/TACO1
VQKAVQEADIKIEEANLIFDPNNALELDQKDALQVMNLIEKIEDIEDVQNVYSTLDITDEAIAAMEAA